jgi:hypothetical protein
MTSLAMRPTGLSSCARAATAAELRYRINAPAFAQRTSRIIAIDDGAEAMVRRLAAESWTGDAHFLVFAAPVSVEGLDGLHLDATLRRMDGTTTSLSDEIGAADVVVMIATNNLGTSAAGVIGPACFARGVSTAGLVVAEGDTAEDAVAALRPHAMVLVVTTDEDDIPEMLTALRV